MTNDAKLGMLAGVLGVIVAAVLFAHGSPPAQSQPAAAEQPQKPAPATVAPPVVRPASEPLASTPVARTRKEHEGQSTSRSGATDEEP